MKRNIFVVTCLMLLSFMVSSCATVPPGSPETGYSIHGFVGESSEVAAVGKVLTLKDGDTGKIIRRAETDFMGKYIFSGLNPGYYHIVIGELKVNAILNNENKRLDLDLSKPDGLVNRFGDALQDIIKLATESATSSDSGGSGGSTAKASGPNDPNLQREMAGHYVSFSGAGYGSSSGTYRTMTLCPNGTFNDSSESSYSGDITNNVGDVTDSWGTASQGADSGKWTINGTKMQGTITLFYRGGTQRSVEIKDCSQESGGCYYIDGIKYGWGSPKCQ